MAKPDILILRPVMQTVTDQLARRFPLSRLWEESDRDAFLDRVGPGIRGVVAGGPVDAALIARLPALEIVSNFGVGYDGVDTAACAAACSSSRLSAQTWQYFWPRYKNIGWST